MSQQPLDSRTLGSATVEIRLGDSLRVLRQLPSNSFDAVVCDPPYAMKATSDPAADRLSDCEGLRCAGCGVSAAVTGYDSCADCLNELRIVSFADAAMLGQQSANWHEKATHSRGYADNDNTVFGTWVLLWAVECLRVLRPGGHLLAFGGTRTWHRLACSIEDAGFQMRDCLAWLYATGVPKSLDVSRAMSKLEVLDPLPTDGAIQAPRRREVPSAVNRPGMFTGVKPAHEPIVLARKPVLGTVAENVRAFGTGALDIDGTRLGDGRWPTNVFLDVDQAERLDRQIDGRGSRYFFVAKPGARERVTVDGVAHPTVKPLTLMRELVRLVTPPAGVVLDPFAGSGTTAEACALEGRDCVAIEREPQYIPLIVARLDRHRLAGPPSGAEGDPTRHDVATPPSATPSGQSAGTDTLF